MPNRPLARVCPQDSDNQRKEAKKQTTQKKMDKVFMQRSNTLLCMLKIYVFLKRMSSNISLFKDKV